MRKDFNSTTMAGTSTQAGILCMWIQKGHIARLLIPMRNIDQQTPGGRFPTGTKLLIVDDAPEIRAVLEFLFTQQGAEVLVIDSAASAIQIALTEHPDLILMDMQLPDMDGCKATQFLKRQGFQAAIIAITGSVQDGERERCLLAGCADFVRKPFDLAHLRSVIDRHLAFKRPNP